MKKYILTIVIFILSVLSSSGETLNLGFSGSYNLTQHFSNLISSSTSLLMENKLNSGASGGILVNIPLYSEGLLSMLFKLNYSYLPQYKEKNDHNNLLYSININGNSANYQNINTKLVFNSDYSLISADFLLKFACSEVSPLFKNMFLLFGPSAGYAVSRKYNIEYQLLSPQNAQFDKNPNLIILKDGDRTISIKDTTIPDINNIRYSLNFGLQYDINISGMKISPYLMYNMGLNDVIKSKYDTWSLNYLNTGIDFTLFQF